VFAVAVSLVSVPPLFFGFHLSWLFVGFLFVTWAVGLSFANLWTVERMGRDVPSPRMPGRRIALALAGALVIDCSVALWLFDDEIGRVSAESAKWEKGVHDLQDGRQIQRTFLDQLERDPYVLNLQQQLEQNTKELDGAEEDFRVARLGVLCELDGTCGTGVPGRKSIYWEKVADRDDLQRRRDEISTRLDSARGELKSRVDQLAQEREIATKRIDEINEQLDLLGPAPPKPSWRPAALFDAAKKPVPVALSNGAFLAFLAIDWLFFLLIVRHICSNEGGRDARDALDRLKYRQGAVPYDAAARAGD
jgi:hypothetical protein